MFKKRTRPAAVRSRPASEDVTPADSPAAASSPDRDDTPESASVEEMMLLRKLRRSQQGIELEKLNRGDEKKKKKINPDDVPLDKFGLQHTGSTEEGDEKDALARKVRSNNFTQQTNALDVDKHMMKYIEAEMAKRKGLTREEATKEAAAEADALFGLGERYNVKGGALREEQEGNLTNSLGMLSAIPEIDLGMENRLRNIEETERAKRELAEKRKMEQRDERTDDHLASMRFFRGGPQREVDVHKEMEKARREAAGHTPREPRERPRRPEMATDDVVFERFKKRMRR